MARAAHHVGYFDLSNVLGEAYRQGMMSVNEAFETTVECGFERIITMSDGLGVDSHLREKANNLIAAFEERDYQPYGKWTVAFGPETLWAYSYMFQHDNDAVVARLILET